LLLPPQGQLQYLGLPPQTDAQALAVEQVAPGLSQPWVVPLFRGAVAVAVVEAVVVDDATAETVSVAGVGLCSAVALQEAAALLE